MQFGSSVSVDRGNAFIGAPTTDGHGAVYFFEQQGGAWIQRDKYVAPDIAPGTFGSKVLMRGTLLISDEARDKVYHFTPVADPSAPSGLRWRASGILTGGTENFGTSLAASGCYGFIGSTSRIGVDAPPTMRGFVHIYERCRDPLAGSRWSWIGSLTPPGSLPEDHFGSSLAVTSSGNVLLVGAPGFNGNKGAVYFYTIENGQWTLKQRLEQSNPEPGDLHFGAAVAMEGSLAVIGAPASRDDPASGTSGLAVTFEQINGVWTQLAVVRPPAQSGWAGFGGQVTISTTDRVIVGASHAYSPGVQNNGSVFIYRRAGSALTLETRLTGKSGGDRFGEGVSVGGRTLLVGAPDYGTSVDGSEGQAYIYQLLP